MKQDGNRMQVPSERLLPALQLLLQPRHVPPELRMLRLHVHQLLHRLRHGRLAAPERPAGLPAPRLQGHDLAKGGEAP